MLFHVNLDCKIFRIIQGFLVIFLGGNKVIYFFKFSTICKSGKNFETISLKTFLYDFRQRKFWEIVNLKKSKTIFS